MTTTRYRPDTTAAMAPMKRRFPVKMDGTAGTFVWDRGDRPPANPFEPARSFRGGRRGDIVSLCMTAYHAALGDRVELRTAVRGTHRTYVLPIRPAEGRAFLEALASDDPAVFLSRGTARQWLAALDRAEEMLGKSLSRAAS